MNPLTDLPLQILIEELGRTTGMFLVWFSDSKMSNLHQARVNGGINNEYPWERWVPELVYIVLYVVKI